MSKTFIKVQKISEEEYFKLTGKKDEELDREKYWVNRSLSGYQNIDDKTSIGYIDDEETELSIPKP